VPDHSSPPPEERPSAKNLLAMSEPRTAARMAILGALVLCVVGSFAYVGGWLSPSLLTPGRFADGFQEVFGLHSGFRRNHAKGVCVGG
jgi:catalase